jgi:hypothetical protein
MSSPFNLDKGGKVSRDEYAKLIAENMKRYGGDRDRAVRSANVKAGYGNSTAQRFLHSGASAPKSGGGGGGGGGGRKSGGGGDRTSSIKPSAPNPNANMTTPTSAPGFLPSMTTPTSAPGFLPTQSPTSVENPALGPTTQPGFWDALRGPTTQPSDLPTLGPTTQPGFLPENAVPWDLAVSPPRSGLNWPGATGRPPVRVPANGRNPPRQPQFVPQNAPYAPAPFDTNNPEFTY